MSRIGIFYGSTLGDTEKVAGLIQQQFGDSASLFNVSSASVDDIAAFDLVLFGSSTWGAGDLQDDWVGFVEELAKTDLTGKKAAIFGLGDQMVYAGTFVDAMGSIYRTVQECGAEVIGAWPVDGYDFAESTAVVDGKFVGLPLDENNQGDQTENRIKNWVAGLLAAV